MPVCVCVCARVCVRACVRVRAPVTSCFELPVNVVECYTWRVLVCHQFKDEESHDTQGLETMSIPLGRQLGNATWSVYECNVVVILTIRSNSTALDLHDGVIVGYNPTQGDSLSPQSQILLGLASSTIEREGDGIL